MALMFEEFYLFLLSTIPSLGNIHVWSLVVYIAFCLVAFYKISKYYNIVISALLTLLVGIIANDFYETIWTAFAQIPSRTVLIPQDMIILSSLVVLLFVVNRKTVFLRINKTFVILISLEILSFFVLYFTGHYEVLRPWFLSGGQTPDPHNWLWMINKGLGAFALYPLILSKEQRNLRLKGGKRKRQ
jgi:hypothetical protein